MMRMIASKRPRVSPGAWGDADCVGVGASVGVGGSTWLLEPRYEAADEPGARVLAEADDAAPIPSSAGATNTSVTPALYLHAFRVVLFCISLTSDIHPQALQGWYAEPGATGEAGLGLHRRSSRQKLVCHTSNIELLARRKSAKPTGRAASKWPIRVALQTPTEPYPLEWG